MAQTLEELIRSCAKDAEKEMLRLGGVPPLFMGITKGGQKLKITNRMLENLGLDINDGHDKDKMARLIRVLFNACGAEQYVHVCEVWMVREDDSEEGERLKAGGRPKLMPRDDPRRYESVMIYAEDRSGGQLIGHQSIIRPSLGQPYLDDDLTVGAQESFTGRFAGVLKYELTEEDAAMMKKLAEKMRDAKKTSRPRGAPNPTPKHDAPDTEHLVFSSGRPGRQQRGDSGGET